MLTAAENHGKVAWIGKNISQKKAQICQRLNLAPPVGFTSDFQFTVTAIFIDGWMLHRTLYEPALSNV